MLVPQPIGEKAASLSTNFRVSQRLPLDENEINSILPVHSYLGRWQIRIYSHWGRCRDNSRRRRSWINHNFDHRIGNVRSFECFQSFGARVEAYRVRSNAAHRTNLSNDTLRGESQHHHAAN